MTDHEGHLLGGCLRRGHDQVALILAIRIVDDDNQFAGSDRGDGFFNRIEGHEPCP